MEYSLGAKVVLTLNYEEGEEKSHHVSTKFNLEVDKNIEESAFLEDGFLTAGGAKAVSNILVQGLIANISMAEHENYRDKEEHFEWIVKELRRGIDTPGEVREDTF